MQLLVMWQSHQVTWRNYCFCPTEIFQMPQLFFANKLRTTKHALAVLQRAKCAKIGTGIFF